MEPNHLIDQILEKYSRDLSRDYAAYRNHAQRVYHICMALGGQAFEWQLAVAAAFHDLGLWTNDTWDYLDPSVRLAEIYCKEQGQSDHFPEIKEIIIHHHKISRYKGPFPAAEFLRKADLVDLSFHRIKYSIPRNMLDQLSNSFPFAGFHQVLWKMFLANLRKNPLRPMPMMRR